MRQGAGHDAEVGERVGADRAAIALQVTNAVLQVPSREFGQLGMEPGAHGHDGAVGQRGRLLRHLVGTGHEPDAFGRVLERVVGGPPAAGLVLAHLPARGEAFWPGGSFSLSVYVKATPGSGYQRASGAR